MDLIGGTLVQVLPSIFILAEGNLTVPDAGFVTSQILDTTDPISNPSNPLPDFGDSVNLVQTRDWEISWGIILDLENFAWAGTNPAGLFAIVRTFVGTVALSNLSEDLHRLYIPSNAAQPLYTGHSRIDSQQARLEVQNQSGDNVHIRWNVWAKPW